VESALLALFQSIVPVTTTTPMTITHREHVAGTGHETPPAVGGPACAEGPSADTSQCGN
jgi:hypothetical protein